MFPNPLARTRANAVYQFMIDRATERFQKTRGVHWVQSRGRILLNIRDEVIVGFKKPEPDIAYSKLSYIICFDV